MASRIDIGIDRFSFSGKGNYVWKADRRELLQLIHPWTPSAAGDFGQIEAEVTLPADAQPPFTLVFYVMDNNYTGPENTGADWINRDLRVGHRFRQALVDGQAVWQEDTCLDDISRHTLVDVTAAVKPGVPFRLAFRLWDAVDSSVTLPGDVYVTEHYATKVATATRKAEKDRHETRSYWGDVALYSGAVPREEEIPWGWRTVLPPPPPPSPAPGPQATTTVRLALEQAELLEGPWPWPVRQGVPFAQGALPAEAGTRLTGAGGAPLPAELRELNAWPDGTRQWALLAFTLPAKSTGPLELSYGTAVDATAGGAPALPVRTQDPGTAANGLVTVRAAARPEAVLSVAGAQGPAVLQGLSPYLRAGEATFAAVWTRGEWLQRSAQEAEYVLDGHLSTPTGERYGACRLRTAVFAGCPYVRLLFTITNQRSEKAFTAAAYGLRLEVAGATAGPAEAGWAALTTPAGSLTVAGRWFAGQWPNGIEPGPGGIDLQLFRPGDARLPAYTTHPGEAKTHEVWLAVTAQAPTAEDCRRLAALVDTPPGLGIGELIRNTRVWGELPEISPTAHAEVYAAVDRVLAPYFQKCKESIRLFGEYPDWDNYYWNTLHTLHCLYAMTGERRWLDWVERAYRHHADVDVCHWQPEKDAVGVVGAMHGYWGDHSDTPCYSLIQNCDGAFDHWNLTGDPEARATAVGIAEYVRTSQSIGRGGSTREQGWPVVCMLAAWRQTGEAKYGEHARALVETALGFEERRRGTYIENHGSVSYLGPTPFMYGILCTALRQYHLRTGDDRAAVLVARLASAVYEESHDPWHSKTLPNLDYYYSPNPYLRGGDGFTPITTLNLNIASAQAYGAYVTRDAALADIARRSWLAGLAGGTVYAEMAYDLAGIVWWLDRLAGAGLLPTGP
jgi:hypothetical protein